ncbi:uncharacterized protein BXZ73DRAFT_107680 [Epithele typhae]|uniref:uncharacterized protein n=1 Tax=Epithele typhae TaxID=378194 RepID=UPI00200856C7|nr:uncharacterized protein BXZ73DRAFT_107680 [Epithele typhae]KAH9912047.1 hypothetical protein BXZ73DRAFT_107680 [Epithele typhae]
MTALPPDALLRDYHRPGHPPDPLPDRTTDERLKDLIIKYSDEMHRLCEAGSEHRKPPRPDQCPKCGTVLTTWTHVEEKVNVRRYTGGAWMFIHDRPGQMGCSWFPVQTGPTDAELQAIERHRKMEHAENEAVQARLLERQKEHEERKMERERRREHKKERHARQEEQEQTPVAILDGNYHLKPRSDAQTATHAYGHYQTAKEWMTAVKLADGIQKRRRRVKKDVKDPIWYKINKNVRKQQDKEDDDELQKKIDDMITYGTDPGKRRRKDEESDVQGHVRGAKRRRDGQETDGDEQMDSEVQQG